MLVLLLSKIYCIIPFLIQRKVSKVSTISHRVSGIFYGSCVNAKLPHKNEVPCCYGQKNGPFQVPCCGYICAVLREAEQNPASEEKTVCLLSVQKWYMWLKKFATT